eukprot:CAMPEP_0115093520 /NCGR_PEP_ID=MMETSP0227-20121206/27630_1 /TAXON_ID=89957 /ORGANISM="Polarella glacialis, Strain CCMP 1383" /LENGTH=59 /DNA_ID=CAMNT_0002485985 /DNA_START=128 /DNA_END=307 /DNA_ORIENTATION=+
MGMSSDECVLAAAHFIAVASDRIVALRSKIKASQDKRLCLMTLLVPVLKPLEEQCTRGS